jgi:hypothetical protein
VTEGADQVGGLALEDFGFAHDKDVVGRHYLYNDVWTLGTPVFFIGIL